MDVLPGEISTEKQRLKGFKAESFPLERELRAVFEIAEEGFLTESRGWSSRERANQRFELSWAASLREEDRGRD